uniref:KH domain-containing, RNA-binding, signal transduction-associated protein 1 n=1 Tax=Oreochromis niloticus TaxID=8128 RepID=A0A669CSR1_ORENI
MENDDKYLPELLAEKDSLDSSFTHAMKLLNAEIDRIQKGETKKETETYLDLFTTKNIKLKERVLIPVKQYPKFNFVGKILGPQGNTIKRLQEETGAKISVLGKGSMRDKAKEEGLRKSGEPKYAHLSMELHVFIEVFAPVPEAYLRMAHAMEEVKKFLFPDMMDDICQEQFMEMSYLNGGQDHGARGRGGLPVRGRGVPPAGAHRGRGMPPRGAAARGGVTRGGPARGGAVRGAPAGRGGPPAAPARELWHPVPDSQLEDLPRGCHHHLPTSTTPVQLPKAMTNMATMRATQTRPTSLTTAITVSRRQNQNIMTMDMGRPQSHTSPMARMTGTAPSGQLQGRPLSPLEAARRLTGSTHIDSTEADSPPLVSP